MDFLYNLMRHTAFEGCLCGCGFVKLEYIDVYNCMCSGSQLVLKVEPNLKKKHQNEK